MVDTAFWNRFRRRFFTSAGNRVALSVDAGATSVSWTFDRSEVDTQYGVVALASWNAGAHLPAADKSTTGLTLRFGTAAPIGGGVVDLATFRSE